MQTSGVLFNVMFVRTLVKCSIFYFKAGTSKNLFLEDWPRKAALARPPVSGNLLRLSGGNMKLVTQASSKPVLFILGIIYSGVGHLLPPLPCKQCSGTAANSPLLICYVASIHSLPSSTPCVSRTHQGKSEVNCSYTGLAC